MVGTLSPQRRMHVEHMMVLERCTSCVPPAWCSSTYADVRTVRAHATRVHAGPPLNTPDPRTRVSCNLGT